MRKITLYQIDAFSERVFSGNPAAVCPLEGWLPDPVMQAVAAENNLSETAFFVVSGDDYHIRWFTPQAEVDLCGHATLASAFVLFTELEPTRSRVTFHSRSGPLHVTREDDLLAMDFPSQPPSPCKAPPALLDGLGREPREVLRALDYLAVFKSESEIRALQPRPDLLAELDLRAVIVTAPGDEADFVSRFFAPKVGIPEDPVTGSAHCALTPFWSARLKRAKLHARQVSGRGGELFCRDEGPRVSIAGRAVKYLEGSIWI